MQPQHRGRAEAYNALVTNTRDKLPQLTGLVCTPAAVAAAVVAAAGACICAV
jgi:hypothetical protein